MSDDILNTGNNESGGVDDILGMLESNDKPYKEVMEEKKPEPVHGDDKKVNYYEDTDITKTKINPQHIHKVDKSFTVMFNKGEDGLSLELKNKILELTKVLAMKGFIFRYNGDNDPIYKEITSTDGLLVDAYLPWKKFNTGLTGKTNKPSPTAYQHTAYYHKGFSKLPNTVRAILASHVHVLLGEDCKRATSFMIVYTPDGCESAKDINFKTTGHISFDIALADEAGIPIFNLKNEGALNRLIEYVKTLN